MKRRSGSKMEHFGYILKSSRNDRETFKIGDRVADFPRGIKGVVVGFRGDRVVFDTYELGRCSRPASWLTKLN
jgi:hypothetical protein